MAAHAICWVLPRTYLPIKPILKKELGLGCHAIDVSSCLFGTRLAIKQTLKKNIGMGCRATTVYRTDPKKKKTRVPKRQEDTTTHQTDSQEKQKIGMAAHAIC